MYELVITEKPNASKRVADALADGKAEKEMYNGVPYYRLTHNKKKIVVGCAVGHLFGLAEKEKTKNFKYPIFDIDWTPTYLISKSSSFAKKYFDTLKKLAKGAETYTVACDYDIEGEVIGLNVIRLICNRNEARRMKFSTLTKQELIKAYDNASPHLDWGQAEAGVTRHYLDYFYGINLSRALTSAIKKAGSFKILSTGRVQGPSLKIIADKEKEIRAFKSVPFWQIELNGDSENKPIIAWHKEDKFWKKEKADVVMQKVGSEKIGKIGNVEAKRFKQAVPVPFDLTTLQTEAYRNFGTSPKMTLGIAQELYTNGLISYPRTSSQKLPASIGYRQILKDLSKQEDYSLACKKLLKTKLTPSEGKKIDPAHPAIYPTGIKPKRVEDRSAKIYDLIVKRFFSVFGEPAVRETVTIDVTVKGQLFIARGTRTVEKNWHELYSPYVKLEEEELPAVKVGDKVDIKQIKLHAKETQPPKRYTPSSIIRELEKRGLGTKATRADIIDTLYKRNYVKGERLEVTDLGMHIIEVLEDNCPKIIDEGLTKHFEKDMEEIQEQKKKKEEVLAEAKSILIDLLKEFKSREKKIGEGLKKTFTETRASLITVGNCLNCKMGNLILRRGRYGRFIACDKYPDCKTTFKLPAAGLVEVSGKVCEHCKHPIIKIIKGGKRPQEICINQECPSKKIKIEIEERSCPKCKKGKLVLRKSVYGAFIACDKFPKCRYTEKIGNNQQKS